ncbi:MAG: TatD family hydrolase [Patescibacteria group bacterium]
MLIDTHCHIQFNAYKDDADEVLKRCQEKGMVLNAVGSQRDTSLRAVEYAEKYDFIYATVGLHPIHTHENEVDEEEIKFKSREEDFDYGFYKKLASHPKVIAIGECGLELYHVPENIDKEKFLEKQKEIFLAQIQLAQELDLPLVIHVRDAHKEIIEILEKQQNLKGVVHCYTSNWENAQKYLDMGLYLGFTGVITFPPKKTDPQSQIDLLEVVKNCPSDRILIETDAPYLAPQAYRGQRCEPWMVEEVAKKIAETRGQPLADIENIVFGNAKKLFIKIP